MKHPTTTRATEIMANTVGAMAIEKLTLQVTSQQRKMERMHGTMKMIAVAMGMCMAMLMFIMIK